LLNSSRIFGSDIDPLASMRRFEKMNPAGIAGAGSRQRVKNPDIAATMAATDPGKEETLSHRTWNRQTGYLKTGKGQSPRSAFADPSPCVEIKRCSLQVQDDLTLVMASSKVDSIVKFRPHVSMQGE
jgi:hypothetical protein